MRQIHHDRELLQAVLEAFTRTTGLKGRVAGFQPKFPGTAHFRPDALIELEAGKKPLRFLVEIKRVDRLDTATQARAFWREGKQPALLLVAPFITAHAAQRCRELRLFFMDAAGNAYIDGPGIYVFVTGNKRPIELPVVQGGRMNNPATMKVIFALLCQPDLIGCPYREIAAAANVALGTVGPAIKELEKRGHMRTFRTATPQRKLADPERLLKEWVEFYPANLRPKLRPRRFLAPDFMPFAEINLEKYGGYWGGEVAGARLTHYLKPQTATVYADQPPARLAADNRLRADLHGNVEFLDIFWNADTIRHRPGVVPPILAYADLVATQDGRNLETARLLYEREIASDIRRLA
ncbi:MAG TPA: type IV toxin-antitoxin system AbiEi family antitoxin [Candidatus Saccharimonadales bacterium]|jgi:hypothetical protein|nr:type IV toxin-antitoxin system AbiEi family antitoxin [Candidatus Saccharimonadales bacterium]